MGIYLKIDKVEENNDFVVYEFDSGIMNCDIVGVMKIDKKTGDCTIIKELVGDKDNYLFGLAYRAVLRHWKKGEFPDKTCWAS